MIKTKEEWLQEYRKDKSRTWLIVEFDNDQKIYFHDFKQWYEFCMDWYDNDWGQDCIPLKVTLQFRSNTVEVPISRNANGLYLIRSLLGRMGGPTTQTITIGQINGQEVSKRVWSTPELTERETSDDSLESCFEEAYIEW